MSSSLRVFAIAAVGVGTVIGGASLLGSEQTSSSAPQATAPDVFAEVVSAVTTLPVVTEVAGAATLPAATVPPEPAPGCAAVGPSAAIDRDNQTGWLCADGQITRQFPISTAWSMPDPGVYEVYAKDRTTTSTFGGYFSTLKNFVAFTYGKNTGARIAFHAIPILSDGSLIQPVESVGDLGRRGESSGCIRVVADISELIWDTLSIGDTVTVVS